jgi:hypothetical protein
MKEIKLACFFTAYYEITLSKEDIQNAIQCEHYEWLNYVWAFKKNYIGDYPVDNKKPTFVKMEDLFEWIGEKYNKQVEGSSLDP